MSTPSEGLDQNDSFLTIATKSEGIYKEQGSKFLYFVLPVSSEEMIKQELAALRKIYFDASHHCYAWILGKEALHFRANDDGEPNHSAGDPILGQIRSRQLTDVLIVVVRYFGGTKLGVSGLIKAYKTAASLGIDENEIIRKWVKISLNLRFSYPVMNEVMKVVKAHDLEIIEQQMALDCNMILSLREGLATQIRSKLEEIESMQITTD